MKVLFMGTPEFALPCLKILEEYEVVGVVTQPDRPKGRGQKMAQPPIKEYAVSKGICVYQPTNLKNEELKDTIQKLKPDIIIVVAYGRILPSYILEYPKYGCINVHASLLPKYRGAGPIQWSIIKGEKYTGVTTMYMDEGMDTGDIILKKQIQISSDETAGQLHDTLSIMGAELLKYTIDLIKKGCAPRQAQESKQATYAPMLNKNVGKIDWFKSALEIKNLVRGVNPWPGAFAKYKDNIIKIWRVDIEDCCSDAEPGTILTYEKDKGLFIKAGDNNCVIIKELQLQGKNKMTIDEYLRGYSIEIGKRFT